MEIFGQPETLLTEKVIDVNTPLDTDTLIGVFFLCNLKVPQL